MEAMIPLRLAPRNEDLVVRKISGGERLVRHVKEMGITEGSFLRIVSDMGGNLIVRVKESRLALSSELSGKIYV